MKKEVEDLSSMELVQAGGMNLKWKLTLKYGQPLLYKCDRAFFEVEKSKTIILNILPCLGSKKKFRVPSLKPFEINSPKAQ